MPPILILVAGLATLTVGADFLVRGASSIAARLGLSPLLIGLTIVAFGTSAPELAVSLKAGFAGQGGIALGNIIGSNIFNVAVILGLSAAICPLVVNVQLVRREMPILLLVSIVFVAMVGLGGGVSRLEGAFLVVALLVYLVASVRSGRRETALEPLPETQPSDTIQPSSLGWSIGLLIVGLAMLVFGARWFVESAVEIARGLGWSEATIGLTIVAAGTSMPELATSIVAAFRRQTDIAIGNVVGSNLFNLLCIGGITATITPLEISGIRLFDLGAMLLTSALLLPLLRSGWRLSRWEGGVLLAAYLGYLWQVWP